MGVKISNLPDIVTPALTDIFPVVQDSVTYKETGTQLSTLFATAGANSNITSLIGITGVIQAPTFINDTNGNHVVQFGSVASAVNYNEILNSATGVAVEWSAQGTDPNIGMNIRAKGTGAVSIISAAVTTPLIVYNGTTSQHATNFAFANTSATRTVTVPDFTGTAFLISKANGVEAANAVTASGTSGVITTSALTTAGAANYAITWTNTFIASTSIILLTIMGGTNTTENITLTVTPGSGTATLTIYNNTAATALNGTILIGYQVIP